MTDIENVSSKMQHLERVLIGIEYRLRAMETSVAVTRGEYDSLQRFLDTKFQVIEQDTKVIFSKLIWVIIVSGVMY